MWWFSQCRSRLRSQLAQQFLHGKIVIDTNNYYPDRDGTINALDRRQTTMSQMIASHFQGATIIKASTPFWRKTFSVLVDFQTEPSVPCRLRVTMPPPRSLWPSYPTQHEACHHDRAITCLPLSAENSMTHRQISTYFPGRSRRLVQAVPWSSSAMPA
jgi:hypothetical protein